MALLTIEGWESRAARTGWALTGPTYVAGRFGGSAFYSSFEARYTLPAPADTVYIGMAKQLHVSNSGVLFDFFDAGSSNQQARITVRADRILDISRGTATVIASSAGPIGGAGEWVFVEAKAKIADAGGAIEVKVNGVVVATFSGDTVQNTSAGNNNGVTSISVWGQNGGPIDDTYVCDGTGSAPYNTYLGEVQVETLVPNANGAFSQLVGSDGNSVDNYLLVDELPAVEADLVQSDVVGNRDSYGFTNPTIASGQVLAVQTTAAISKANAGPAKVKLTERVSGTDRKSAAMPASNLTQVSNSPQTTDPNGAVWTIASVSGAEFGVEVA